MNLLIQLFFSIIPIFFIILPLIIKKNKVADWSKILFWGCLSILLSLLLAYLFSFAKVYKGFLPILYFILVTGIPEEVSKYIGIIGARSKNKNQIVINGLLISGLFTVIEDLLYYSEIVDSWNWYLRILTPAHFLFQLIMIYFLCKAFDKKEESKFKFLLYNLIAILVPSILHGIYNSLVTYSIPHIFSITLGIITYIIVFIVMLKVENKNLNNAKSFSKTIRYILSILMILFFIFSANSANNNLNDTVLSPYENLEITVLDVEEIEIADSLFDSDNGIYTKIKVKLVNKGNKEVNMIFSWNLLSNNNSNGVSFTQFDDSIDPIIEPNETLTGYLYFKSKYNKNAILNYTNSDLKSPQNYKFNLNK